jgi:hypothetical protein
LPNSTEVRDGEIVYLMIECMPKNEICERGGRASTGWLKSGEREVHNGERGGTVKEN